MESNLNFRTLRASEIDVRGGQRTKQGDKIALLLYKDARCDMSLLDEVVGPMRWKREHQEIKGVMYCGVSIYDEERKQWVTKLDAGTESNTEEKKGEASDSFKRACVNWGIGRELYTAPRIYVDAKTPLYDLRVSDIAYNEQREITRLKIVNQYDKVIYQYPQAKGANAQQTAPAPNTAPAPAAPKPSPEQLDTLFLNLSEREIAEYDDACRQMKAATVRSQVVGIYNRFIQATFAPLLLDFGKKTIKEKGLK